METDCDFDPVATLAQTVPCESKATASDPCQDVESCGEHSDNQAQARRLFPAPSSHGSSLDAHRSPVSVEDLAHQGLRGLQALVFVPGALLQAQPLQHVRNFMLRLFRPQLQGVNGVLGIYRSVDRNYYC